MLNLQKTLCQKSKKKYLMQKFKCTVGIFGSSSSQSHATAMSDLYEVISADGAFSAALNNFRRD